MICRKCGNDKGFLSVVTDYKPLELWEFNSGVLTRYCQKDSGDVDIEVQCASCGSQDIAMENFDMSMYPDRPLVILQEDEWEEKTAEFKKEEKEEEEAETETSEENQEEPKQETQEEPNQETQGQEQGSNENKAE
jgi:hypothetical protein